MRFYEEIQQNMVAENAFANYQMKSVKVYNKKNLLDELVDHLA